MMLKGSDQGRGQAPHNRVVIGHWEAGGGRGLEVEADSWS